MKILAVDDDPLFLELLTRLLRAIGHYDVTLAESPAQALKMLDAADQPFDCILCDMQMPKMGGVAFIEKIRARKESRRTPILVITSTAGKSFVHSAFKAGATDYITKPLDQRELASRIGMVTRLLSERQRMDQFARLAAQGGVSLDSKPDFAAPVQIPGFSDCMDFTALENYVTTLGPKRAYATAALGIHIDNAGAIFARAGGATFMQMLGNVAGLITDALKGRDALLAYAGGGTFVVLTDRDAAPNPDEMEWFINIGLMGFKATYAADRLPVPHVHLGDVARAPFLSGGKPPRIVERAIATAIGDDAHKVGKLVA